MEPQPWKLATAVGVAWVATYVTSRLWLNAVTKEVTEPYLVRRATARPIRSPLKLFKQDEVFHVRQAQVYCAGDFATWDPKITTPPGVYVVVTIGIPFGFHSRKQVLPVIHLLQADRLVSHQYSAFA